MKQLSSGVREVDVVVVGSGFGGSVSALRLAEKGYSVVVLERGRRWDPADFPRTNWNMRKFLWMPALKCFGILRLSFLSDVLVLSGSGVGGGSLVYANTLYVPPDAFFESSAWPHTRDWRAALMPHYRRAQFMLGVTQHDFTGELDVMLRDVARKLGREDTFVRTPVGVFLGAPGVTVPDPYFGGAGPERTGCIMCGGCMVGCRHNAKNTLDRNYLYLAEKLGAEIMPLRTVVDVAAQPDGSYLVRHQRSGAQLGRDRQTIRARKVVLSAGVLGTVQLLLECRARGSLPNVSPLLGQRVRTNSEAILGVKSRVDGPDLSRGLAITSSIHPDANTHVEIVRYNKGSDALATLGTLMTDGGAGMPRWLRFLGNVARHPIDFLRGLWPFGSARRGVFLLVMQTLDNSIGLRLRRRWTRLWRRALDSGRSQDAVAMPTYIPLGNQVARIFADELDGVPKSSLMEVLFDVPTTAHILGGAAIGADAGSGVIDEQHQVFGHPGLYVCDGSVVPANLGVNPSLTITALAEHAMSQLPPKPGATPRAAVLPEWEARRIKEIEALATRLKSDSLQSK